MGTSNQIPPCSICEDYLWGTIERHSYINTPVGLNYGNVIGPDNTPYHDQWLDIYMPIDSDEGPFPLYIFAHSGGQEADDAFSNGRDFCEENIAFVSWESGQTSLAAGGSYYENDPNLLMTIKDYWDYAHADFSKVLEWVWQHGAEYNIDLDNVFVGGGSRGSRISFKGLDNPETPVRGIFMTQAFADGDWFNLDIVESQGCSDMSVEEFVSDTYPPMLLHYKNNLGDVINAHDALNGLEVMERYDCYGISARVVHSLGNDYQWPPDAIEFIQNIDDFFEMYPQKVVDASVIDPDANILEAPAQLELQWNSDVETEAKLTWSSNGWEANLASAPYPNKEPDTVVVELRLGPVEDLSSTVLSDICEPLLWIADYSFDNQADLNSFEFPKNNFLNSCLMPYPGEPGFFSLDEGQFYGVQVRTNITPESNFFESRSHKFWTPWTTVLTFEGRCESVINNIGEIDFTNAINIYPNPNNGILNLSTKGLNDKSLLEIFDSSGTVQMTDFLVPREESIQIDLNHLSKGLYWVRLTDSDSVLTRTIIIN
ncbi:MAG: T9SS type A sorting domain-containing protein [Flavobacteriales bacterium]|nr:T9SS type A sorting domain-containing protein [Flavobacteriales bacterium]